MTASYNFALKIETIWAKRVVKPSLKTRNPNDVIEYVWYGLFILWWKKIKSM